MIWLRVTFISILITLFSVYGILASYEGLSNEIKKENISFTNNKNIEYIDGNKSGTTLKIRYWVEGDSFHPLGMTNKRKLSDFFTDLKINTMLKRDIPLVCKGDKIIWISGYRLNNLFKVSTDTKIVYKLELIKIEKK